MSNRTHARNALADILLNETSTSAFDVLVEKARRSRQSVKETALRTAGNLLNSLTLDKQG